MASPVEPTFPWTPEQVHSVQLALRISCGFGFLGALASLCCNNKIRGRQRDGKQARHVIYINYCVGELMVGAALFTSTWAMDTSWGCKTQAFVMILGNGGIFWTTALMLDMYLHLAHGWTEAKLMSLMPLYYLLGWVYPLSFAIVLAKGDYFMPVGPWCWISDEYKWAQIATHYGWAWFGTVFGIFAVIRLTCIINKNVTNSRQQLKGAPLLMVCQMWMFAVVFNLIWVPDTVSFAFLHFPNSVSLETMYGLMLYLAVAIPLQGVFYFFIYVGPTIFTRRHSILPWPAGGKLDGVVPVVIVGRGNSYRYPVSPGNEPRHSQPKKEEKVEFVSTTRLPLKVTSGRKKFTGLTRKNAKGGGLSYEETDQLQDLDIAE